MYFLIFKFSDSVRVQITFTKTVNIRHTLFVFEFMGPQIFQKEQI